PNYLAQTDMPNPEMMAVDLVPGEYRFWISLLTDVSGSMLQDEEGSSGDSVPLEKTKLAQASLGAIVLREGPKNIAGVRTEEYAYSTKPAIRLRDYKDSLTDKLAAEVHQNLFSEYHGGTSDAEALRLAIERMKKDHPQYSGLRVYGIGIGVGPATKTVI